MFNYYTHSRLYRKQNPIQPVVFTLYVVSVVVFQTSAAYV